MRFHLTFAPTADRSFSALPHRIQLQFDRAFDALAHDPRRGDGRLDIHQLYGYQNVWTLRIPPFRAIYVIEGADVVIVVFGHRDNVYSLLHHLIPPRRQTVSTEALSGIK
jgi:mRNA-degrading endonuclease RelE of RelBE toxin-antitoxin system